MGEGSVRAGLRRTLSLGKSSAGIQISQSLFSYANGGPLRFLDPVGLFTIDPSCNRCVSYPGLSARTSFSSELVQEGIDLAKEMIPCMWRKDLKGCLNKSKGGEDIVIKCGASCCESGEEGCSPGVRSPWFSICGKPFDHYSATGSGDEIGITVFHEWLHASCKVDSGPGGAPDDAEGIAGNAYYRLMRDMCGSR